MLVKFGFLPQGSGVKIKKYFKPPPRLFPWGEINSTYFGVKKKQWHILLGVWPHFFPNRTIPPCWPFPHRGNTLFSYIHENQSYTNTKRNTGVCCEPNSATKNLRNVFSGWFYPEKKNTKLDLLRPIPLPNLSKRYWKTCLVICIDSNPPPIRPKKDFFVPNWKDDSNPRGQWKISAGCLIFFQLAWGKIKGKFWSKSCLCPWCIYKFSSSRFCAFYAI